jgi:hypothetical protein
MMVSRGRTEDAKRKDTKMNSYKALLKQIAILKDEVMDRGHMIRLAPEANRPALVKEFMNVRRQYEDLLTLAGMHPERNAA